MTCKESLPRFIQHEFSTYSLLGRHRYINKHSQHGVIEKEGWHGGRHKQAYLPHLTCLPGPGILLSLSLQPSSVLSPLLTLAYIAITSMVIVAGVVFAPSFWPQQQPLGPEDVGTVDS